MSDSASRLDFRRGDRIRIKFGLYAGDEGVVIEDQAWPAPVRSILKVLGRDVQLEPEVWLIEKVEPRT